MCNQNFTGAKQLLNLVANYVWLAILLLLLGGCVKGKVYKHPQWKSLQDKHKTIAILPVQMSYTFYKRPKRLTTERVKELEHKAAERLHDEMASDFMERKSDNSVSFQVPSMTDSLLKGYSIDKEKIKLYSEKELAQKLAADGIFKVNVTIDYFRSEIEAVAVMVLSVVKLKTKKISAEATVYDGNSGELFWKYHLSFKGGLLMHDRKIRKILRRKITKRFPY